MAHKIKVNAEVRKLLQEQAELFDQFGSQTRELADRSASNSRAVQVGADRESCRHRIVGVAWRIHCAATGTKL